MAKAAAQPAGTIPLSRRPSKLTEKESAKRVAENGKGELAGCKREQRALKVGRVKGTHLCVCESQRYYVKKIEIARTGSKFGQITLEFC